MKNGDEIMRNDLLLNIFQEYYTLYGQKPLQTPFQQIEQSLQNILIIYQKFPQTCIRLLEQVKLPFGDQEYVQKVTNPIRFHSIRNQNPSLEELAICLDKLRFFLNKDEIILSALYKKEIDELAGNNKVNKFAIILNDACVKAINIIIAEITAANTYQPSSSHGETLLEIRP